MIALENINRCFEVGEQTVQALNDINLEIDAGEYISVMGPSGSGKSTLLNIISLMDQPTSGRYFLNGEDVTRLQDQQLAQVRNKNIGFIFQSFHLIPRMTAAENIELPMMLAGIPVKQRKSRVKQALSQVGLSERAKHLSNQLSGGQRQRVAIARATIMQPAILLADEPTGNLDSHSGREIVQLLEQLQQQGVTLIIITHDADLGQRAQRQLHMADGRLVEQ